jgi:hypothetical protein
MYSKKRIINKFNDLCEWVRDVRLNVAIERYCYGIKWKRVQDVWCQGRHYHAETLERGWWMHDDHDPHQPPSGWHPDLAYTRHTLPWATTMALWWRSPVLLEPCGGQVRLHTGGAVLVAAPTEHAVRIAICRFALWRALQQQEPVQTDRSALLSIPCDL